MVAPATSLGRSGLHDWIIQRITAIVLTAYVLYLTGFVTSAEFLTYEVWKGLFETTWFKIFSLFAVASICFHAWVGMWVISTDYIKPMGVRLVFQSSIVIFCLACLVWGAQILWGV